MTLRTIERRRVGLTKMVYEELKGAISDGRLAPGAPLCEEELARALGVSRTPVREALAQLGRDGFVTDTAFKGKVVRTISRQEHLDINQAYEALQTCVVKTAVTAIPGEELQRVESLLDEAAGAIQRGDLDAHWRTDRAIHRLITRYGNNVVIERLVEGLMLQTFRYYLQSKQNPAKEHVVASFAEHRAILEALKRRDAELAQRAVCEHFRKAAERTKTLFPPDPEAAPT